MKHRHSRGVTVHSPPVGGRKKTFKNKEELSRHPPAGGMSEWLPRGRFITFEGGEGAGKSTQIRLLAQKLLDRNVPVITTREPGGCPLAEQIRVLLVKGERESLSPKTEILLFLAARIEHVRLVIHPALKQGTWVLCDRFLDSTLAYQGYAQGRDIENLHRLHTWALEEENNLTPDLTFLLDVPPDVGLARRLQVQQGPADRFERESLEFHQRVQEGFYLLAKASPDRFRMIDASLDLSRVENKIWKEFCHVFSDIG